MIIDGKIIAAQIREGVKQRTKSFKKMPGVVAMIVGEHPSAESYLKMLEKTCKMVDFNYSLIRLPVDISEKALLNLIEENNQMDEVQGILVQMPLPDHINKEKILLAIDPKKDLDGFHPMNAGRLFKGEKSMKPCTAQAVVSILKALDIGLEGKDVVIIGRSNIVGKPLSILLLDENATVTVCHSKTKDLKSHTQRADIVVAAVGIPNFLTKEMVTEQSIVIDVGMNEVAGKLVGDADFDALEPFVKMITPVPGGVGPVTNAVLLLNILEHFEGA